MDPCYDDCSRNKGWKWSIVIIFSCEKYCATSRNFEQLFEWVYDTVFCKTIYFIIHQCFLAASRCAPSPHGAYTKDKRSGVEKDVDDSIIKFNTGTHSLPLILFSVHLQFKLRRSTMKNVRLDTRTISESWRNSPIYYINPHPQHIAYLISIHKRSPLRKFDITLLISSGSLVVVSTLLTKELMYNIGPKVTRASVQ